MIQVGVDVERIERFSRLTGGWEPFYQRVYTPAERSAFGRDAQLLALCLTAKEAVAKVLGTGLSLGPGGKADCRDIEISCGPRGSQPEVKLAGKALAIKEALGLSRVLLLWHHGSGYAYSIAGAGGVGHEPQLRRGLTIALDSLIARLTALERWNSTSAHRRSAHSRE
jgi:phosphopantetheine--protein transferase-like protein